MADQKRILIVEDDNVLRDVLGEKLEKNGYLVEKAQDGLVAMEKIHANKPDAVLLDILMPHMNGIEVLEELHKDQLFQGIPVVIISNSGQPVEIERARELGAREFLIKAVFDPNEVLEKVRKVMEDDGTAPQGEWGVRTQNITGAGAIANVEAISPEKEDNPQKEVFVLVVEDDKFLRELLVRKLASAGFDVQNAIEGTAAFAILEKRKPSIILLDLILPEMDGFEILTRIKADPKNADVPVIILSNLGQKEDTDKALKLGAIDFMVKANFTLDEIVTKVRTVLNLA